MSLSAATKRRIDRQLRREDLVMRLQANADAIEYTITCRHDRALVALLREAAHVLKGKAR